MRFDPQSSPRTTVRGKGSSYSPPNFDIGVCLITDEELPVHIPSSWNYKPFIKALVEFVAISQHRFVKRPVKASFRVELDCKRGFVLYFQNQEAGQLTSCFKRIWAGTAVSQLGPNSILPLTGGQHEHQEPSYRLRCGSRSSIRRTGR